MTPRTAVRQASLSIINPWSSLKLMSIESVMTSSHLILCRPLLLLPPIPPSIRVFSNESTLRMRWPKYWSFSFKISPSSEYSGLTSFSIDCFDLLAFLSIACYQRTQNPKSRSLQLLQINNIIQCTVSLNSRELRLHWCTEQVE